MSWQSYIDDHLLATKMVSHAAICGHDGSIWASSKEFGVSQDELKSLIAKFNDVGQLAAGGVTIAKTKYLFISNSEKVVRAKKGTSGIHCMKTVQAYIICVYQDPIVPEQAASVTEKLGDYLIGAGY